MVEREQGAERRLDDGAVAHPAGFEPVAARDGAAPAKAKRLAPRPDKGLPFDEALDETMRDHRAVFAALAK